MADTYQQLWNLLLVYSPGLPVPLAKRFVNHAWREAQERHRWSSLRGENGFFIPAEYTTGTVAISQGSTAVVGTGTTFTAAMVGRQLYIASEAPFYTIDSFTDATNITLDRSFEETSVTAATFGIAQVYVDAPADLARLDSVVDVNQNFRLRTEITQEQLDTIDPERRAAGTAWLIAAATNAATNASTTDVRRYEIWPRQTSETNFPYRYHKKVSDFATATTQPFNPFRGDEILTGALAELARWPGTTEKPNPYYNLQTYAIHRSEFLERVDRIDVTDQEHNQTKLFYAGEAHWDELPYAPIDARFAQNHIFVT